MIVFGFSKSIYISSQKLVPLSPGFQSQKKKKKRREAQKNNNQEKNK